jgi:hypothetical protein
MVYPKHKRYVKEHREFREDESFNSILAIVLFDRNWNKHCPSISLLWIPSLPVVATAIQTSMITRQHTPIHLDPRTYHHRHHHRQLPIQQRIPLLLRGLGKYSNSKQTTNKGQNKQTMSGSDKDMFSLTALTSFTFYCSQSTCLITIDGLAILTGKRNKG